MAAVLGVVLYRISVLSALSVYGNPSVTSYAILFTTTTAACINLCCIIVFNWIYVWLAEYLTEVNCSINNKLFYFISNYLLIIISRKLLKIKISLFIFIFLIIFTNCNSLFPFL